MTNLDNLNYKIHTGKDNGKIGLPVIKEFEDLKEWVSKLKLKTTDNFGTYKYKPSIDYWINLNNHEERFDNDSYIVLRILDDDAGVSRKSFSGKNINNIIESVKKWCKQKKA